jgi:mannose-6-phosphate isomerase-like protein (cupin superfamily)
MRSRLLFAILFLACTAGADAQRRGGGLATLAIFVTDPDGNPLTNVRVTVQGTSTRTTRTERGRVAVEELPAGTYRVTFEHPAFLPFEREVTARAGKPMEIKVTLTPAPKPEPPPAPPPPPPAAKVKPAVFDIPAFLEKNFVGRSGGKASILTCASGGSADLLQMRDPYDTHVHPADEFLYVVAGEGTGRVEGTDHRLQAGVLLMVPRGAAHGFIPRGKNPLIVLSIKAGQGCSA